ncbi:MAG: dipeptidase [Cytophagales bacterium]|nr:dipeptidase [Cytophagales bacterium]MDW8385004.1 dipeptidase [Flammeovirgaceae bacterium]
MNPKQYIENHKERFLSELLEWLKIPSVSTESSHTADMKRAAEYLCKQLTSLGLERVSVLPTKGHPVVFAQKIINPSLPTVLIYGHYDVQPTDSSDGRTWTSPPFEPVVRDGKIYARGATDDKGQVYIHVKAIETLLNTTGLTCNVKFLIEGEEEIGSPHLGEFVEQHRNLLQCDVILISDTSILDNDIPSMTVSLRGLSYVEVEVSSANKDLHSGVYGGAVANPINVLCQMIASLHDANRRITIPGFYDNVIQLSEEERKLRQVPFDVEEYKKMLGIPDVWGEKGYTVPELTSIRPTLDVNGIWGGFTGEGSKTVLPSKAFAKISMRLVPNQTCDEITALFTKYFLQIAPPSVRVKVTSRHGGDPYMTNTNSMFFKAAEKAYERTFGKKPLYEGSGGSIPIIPMLKKHLGVDAVLMGFGLDSDDAHSPDEHFGLFNYYIGIQTVVAFYEELPNFF